MRFIKKIYDWVLSWADTKYALPALFLLAVAESSFFPIPPDVLLIALAISIPTKAFRYALIVSIGSVVGGVIGYALGFYFMETVGNSIIALYGFEDKFLRIQELYREYDAWAVAIAGFTPIPYKVFTITAGAFNIDFLVFLVASAVSRSLRFFILAILIYHYGAHIKSFIDRYFNVITIVFTVLLIGGFVLVKFMLH
ncbi:MAG: DedA family protein [Deltaproteobacteria bacterium]|nr:DedA family protein [Deltaproteobacteria bacterium]